MRDFLLICSDRRWWLLGGFVTSFMLLVVVRQTGSGFDCHAALAYGPEGVATNVADELGLQRSISELKPLIEGKLFFSSVISDVAARIEGDPEGRSTTELTEHLQSTVRFKQRHSHSNIIDVSYRNRDAGFARAVVRSVLDEVCKRPQVALAPTVAAAYQGAQNDQSELLMLLQEWVKPYARVPVFTVAKLPGVSRRYNVSARTMVVMGAFLGLAVGVGLCLFLNEIDERFKSPAEVERIIGAPLLGALRTPSPPRAPVSTTDAETPPSFTEESVRKVIIAIQRSRSQCLALGSVSSADWNSQAAREIARVLCRLGKRVAVVDFSGQSDVPASGPPTYSSKEGDLTLQLEKLLTPSHPDNYYVLDAAQLGVDLFESIVTRRAERIPNCLRDQFDHVLMILPDQLASGHAGIIGGYCDSVIVLFRLDKDSRDSVVEYVRTLRSFGSTVMGVVAAGRNAGPRWRCFTDRWSGAADQGREPGPEEVEMPQNLRDKAA